MKLLFSVLLFIPWIANAQTIAANADALLNAYYKQDQFVGTVLIAKEGKILFEKGYGLANRSTNKLNDTGTEFRIGSISKPFTAALILKLQEEGVLSTKDPLNKYIPDYPKGDTVLLEHLLNHTSGIKSITGMKQYYAQWINETASLSLTVSRFKNEPFNFSPGEKFEYSNSNYILLSYIAELATGKSFDQLVHDYIIQPLQLLHTGIDKNDRHSEIKALGYQAVPGNEYADAREVNMSVLAGAGAMYSTVGDLYKWDRALRSHEFLTEASKNIMYTPNKGGYALGWQIDTVNGRLEYSHSGSIDGFKANIIRYPKEDVCIIFLSNYFQSKGPQISKALTAIAFGESFDMPRVRKFVTLNPDELAKYTGYYQMEKGPTMKVFIENGALKGQIEGQSPFPLLAEGGHLFYIKPIDSEMIFSVNDIGEVVEMKIQQQQKVMAFKRSSLQ